MEEDTNLVLDELAKKKVSARAEENMLDLQRVLNCEAMEIVSDSKRRAFITACVCGVVLRVTVVVNVAARHSVGGESSLGKVVLCGSGVI